MSGWLPAEPSSPAGMLAIALLVAFVAVNLWTIWLVYSDKRRARNDERRIPERTLLGWAAAGGLIGLFIGMRAFRHMTVSWQHLHFQETHHIAFLPRISRQPHTMLV